MARKPTPLRVVITPQALRDLDRIWDWNAEEYGADHAETYVSFLRKAAYKLDRDYPTAKPVATADACFYIIVRKSQRRQSHGHVVIFQVVGRTVEILRFFHSRQDWENKFRDGR